MTLCIVFKISIAKTSVFAIECLNQGEENLRKRVRRNGRKWRGEQEGNMYCGCNVKHPLGTVKRLYKDTEKGKEKKHGTDLEKKTEKVTEKVGENIVKEDRLRCENTICILFKY